MNYPFEHILYLLRQNEALTALKTRLYRLALLNCRYILLLVIAESIWFFPPAVRWILLIPLAANGILIFWIRDYLKDKNIRIYPEKNIRLLEELGRTSPEIKDHLINAWQLSRNDDDLSRLAVQRFADKIPPEKLIGFIRDKKSSPAMTSLRRKTLVSGMLLLLAVPFLHNGFTRVFTPGTDYTVPFPWHFQVEPGNARLKEGDSLQIAISHTLPQKYPSYLRITKNENTEEIIPRRVNDTLSTYLLPNLTQSFTYRFTVRRPHIFTPWKERSSPEYSVIVLKRPVPELLEFEVIPPAYTGMEREYYTGGTDRIHLLEGSELLILGRLSLPVGKATITLGNIHQSLEISGRNFQGKIRPDDSGSLILKAEDTSGTALENDLTYGITLFPDEPPHLNVLDPEKDIILNESLTFPWAVMLDDDFGLEAFLMENRIIKAYQQSPDTAWKSHPLMFDSSETRQTASGEWTVPYRLSPGDGVEFRFVARDNNTLTGPGITRSEIFQARFPSMTELFEQSRQQSGEMKGDMEALQDVIKEMQEEAENIRKEIFKKGEADWSEQESLKNLTEKESAIRENLKKIKEALEKQISDLSEQQLFSDEVMDNMGYLRELMEEMENSELFRELRKMQEKLRQDPDAKALQEMSENLEDKAAQFEETLERTIKMLETLRDMEMVEEGRLMLQETLREQTELIENESERRSGELATTEKNLSRTLESLREELERFSQEQPGQTGEALKDFSSQMDALGVTENLDYAAEAFSGNQRQQGLEHAEISRQKMEAMLQQYQEMASGLQQAKKEEILRAFQHLLRRSLLASEKQERLISGTRNLRNDSPRLQDVFSRQNRISGSLKAMHDGLKEIAQKTFFMGPRPFRELEDAFSVSSDILNSLSEGRAHEAERLMTQSVAKINKLTATLLALMGQAQESESGTGMEQFMEQLQTMAEMQGGINQDSQGMPMPGPGNQAMDMMSQLAARQQALRRQLNQLKQAMEQAGEGGGEQLDHISQEMEDVIRDLRQNRVSRRTIQRQRGIEQRLLDASRSLRKRDVSRERESKTGESVQRSGPERLPDDLGNKESLIQEILEKLRQSGLSSEDRQEMERYLEKLRESLE